MSPTDSLIKTAACRRLLQALVVLGVTLGCVAAVTELPAPASASTSTSHRVPYAGFVTRMAARINAVRAAHNLPRVHLDRRLTESAVLHSRVMAPRGRYRVRFHGERAMGTRLRARGYVPGDVGEALSSGPTGHAMLRRVAATSWAPLLDPAMTTVGVGVARSHDRHPGFHRYWLTIVVAHPKQASPAQRARASVARRESSYAAAVLQQLNDERAANGLSRLRMNAKLIASAHGHNLDMAAHNEMSHQCAGEPFFANRIENAGYNYQYAGENIGWNSVETKQGVLQLETIMYNEKPPEDGHRQNILSPNYTNVGVDVYFDKTNDKVWLTEDFGKPANW